MHYKVKDHKELVKDKDTGALLLADMSAAQEYKNRKAMMNQNRSLANEINSIRAEMVEFRKVKDDLSEIKEILQRIVDR